jgi:hypothetical protein
MCTVHYTFRSLPFRGGTIWILQGVGKRAAIFDVCKLQEVECWWSVCAAGEVLACWKLRQHCLCPRLLCGAIEGVRIMLCTTHSNLLCVTHIKDSNNDL